jgi:hypothetical protein
MSLLSMSVAEISGGQKPPLQNQSEQLLWLRERRISKRFLVRFGFQFNPWLAQNGLQPVSAWLDQTTLKPA